MKAAYQCAIFDLDGVIVDTAKFHFFAWKKIAATLGYILTDKNNDQLKGVSRVDSLKRILQWSNTQLDTAKFESLLVQKNKDYLELIQGLQPQDILPGIPKTLTFLKQNKIKIGLGSASKNAIPILEKLKILDIFDVVIDGNQVMRSKPDPEVFIKGSTAMQVNPKLCVVFEDASSGIEAANAAGMKAVGIGSKEDLIGASICFPSFDAISVNQLSDLFNLS